MKQFSIITILLTITISSFTQTYQEKPISPAVPFLTITPDARAAGMAELGAATTADVASIYHNPAKIIFSDFKAGLNISYSPWLRKLASDMMINYLSFFYKFNPNQAFSTSIKYFSIGEIQFTNQFGQNTTIFKPNEFAIDASYNLRLTEKFAGAISLRFIYSNLTGGSSNVAGSHAGIAFASDLAFFYNKTFKIAEKKANFAWGINLSNIGTKISYGTNANAFIPTNFKTGVAFTYEFDDFNKLLVGVDINKLMVPSPPVYDSLTNEIIKGVDPNKTSVISGIFSSFADAPNGFTEELHEIYLSTGAEYSYNNKFFARAGYYYEHPNKGNRQYITAGAGFKYNILSIDFSYLVPINTISPLEGTMRFSISFYFNKANK